MRKFNGHSILIMCLLTLVFVTCDSGTPGSSGSSGNNPGGSGSGNNLIGPPTNISMTRRTSGSITLGWSAVSGASGYYVYCGTDALGPYRRLGSSSSTSALCPELYSNTTYYFKVSAVNSAGEGPQSSYFSAATLSFDAPKNVSASLVTGTGIPVITWDPVPLADGYAVQRSTSNSQYENRGFANIPFHDFEAEAYTTYYYRVAAYKNRTVNREAEVSPFSSPVSVTSGKR